MLLKHKFFERLKTLNAHQAVIHHKKIGGKLSDKILAKIEEATPFELPAEMIAFYREINGIELSWSLKADEESIFGSISILPLRRALFGDVGVISGNHYENAFKDMLWNDFYSPSSINKLKKHRVFESVEGEPTYITFLVFDGKIQLFRVEEETIQPIQTSFEEYLDLLFETLGTGRLREHLISKQWKQKIGKDSEIQFISKL